MTYRTKQHTYLDNLTAIGKRAHAWAKVQPVSLILANLRAAA